MCGIAAFSLDQATEVPPHWLSTARSLLGKRGPDDSGIFEDPHHGVALIHTRLAILDVSETGHQPMVSDDNSVVLVFNGEIYNFPQLRLELESDGYQFRGNSDTEVLLNLYLAYKHRHGKCSDFVSSFLRRLNGVFSFALWDSHRQALLIARDALGVKPSIINTEKMFYFLARLRHSKSSS